MRNFFKIKKLVYIIVLIIGITVLQISALSQNLPIRVKVEPRGITFEDTEEIQDGSYGNAPRRVKVKRHRDIAVSLIGSKLQAYSFINIKYISGKVNLGNGVVSTPKGVMSKAPAPPVKFGEADFEPVVPFGFAGALYGVWATIYDDSYHYDFRNAFLIGIEKKSVEVPKDKYLFLFINDIYYNDNSGFYEVEVSLDSTKVFANNTEQLFKSYTDLYKFYQQSLTVTNINELEQLQSAAKVSVDLANKSTNDSGLKEFYQAIWEGMNDCGYLRLVEQGKINKQEPAVTQKVNQITEKYVLESYNVGKRAEFCSTVPSFQLYQLKTKLDKLPK